MASSSPACVDLFVACLCAQWCDACCDYRALFDQQASKFATQAGFLWVDIEEHDEVLGGVEVDNFPTLLIARGNQTVFFGTVTPRASTFARLVQSALRGEFGPVVDGLLDGLPQRLRSLGDAAGAE